MLIILTFLFLTITPGKDTILLRPDVQKSIASIYQDTFVKRMQFESGLLVRKDSVDFTSGVRGDIFFLYDSGLLALIHTHPDEGFEKPSDQDVRMSVKFKMTIYVISLHQVWVSDPDGTVRRVN